MAERLEAKLDFNIVGKQFSVEVSSSKASSLFDYLTSMELAHPSPPPSSTGMESIAFGNGMKTDRVKTLLEGWA